MKLNALSTRAHTFKKNCTCSIYRLGKKRTMSDNGGSGFALEPRDAQNTILMVEGSGQTCYI